MLFRSKTGTTNSTRAASTPTIGVRDERPAEGNLLASSFNNSPGVLPPVLAEIVAHKRIEIAALRDSTPLQDLKARAADHEPPRNFFAAVTRHSLANPTAVIAEVKRQSPSAGLIRPEYAGESFRPEVIAEQYWASGAAAISCLTEIGRAHV